jgi:hypothetical protein
MGTALRDDFVMAGPGPHQITGPIPAYACWLSTKSMAAVVGRYKSRPRRPSIPLAATFTAWSPLLIDSNDKLTVTVTAYRRHQMGHSDLFGPWTSCSRSRPVQGPRSKSDRSTTRSKVRKIVDATPCAISLGIGVLELLRPRESAAAMMRGRARGIGLTLSTYGIQTSRVRKCGTCADREPAASAGGPPAGAGILSGDAQNANRSPRFSAYKGRSATPLRSSCSIRFSQPGFMCVSTNAIELGNDAMSSSSERGE